MFNLKLVFGNSYHKKDDEKNARAEEKSACERKIPSCVTECCCQDESACLPRAA